MGTGSGIERGPYELVDDTLRPQVHGRVLEPERASGVGGPVSGPPTSRTETAPRDKLSRKRALSAFPSSGAGRKFEPVERELSEEEGRSASIERLARGRTLHRSR